MPRTDDLPKCMLEVGNKRILDWILEALRASEIEDIVFIGGYQIQEIKLAYPHLKFCHNTNWENNNILESLFYAEKEMNEVFVTTYSDVVYRKSIVNKLIQSKADITLVVDTDWRSHYVGRFSHPETEAEKVLVKDDKIIQIGKHLDPDEAYGEFIGLAKFSKHGAEVLKVVYHEIREKFWNGQFQRAPSIKKAYLTDMIQELIDRRYAIHKVNINGGWMEIDTEQDFKRARKEWK